MKRYTWLVVPLIICAACGNKESMERTNAPAIPGSAVVNQVVGIGKIEPESEIIQVSSAVNGIVAQVLMKENDTVRAGMPILELNHELEDARVRQLAGEVISEANQIKADEASVSENEVKYSNAALGLQRLQRLQEKGAETQQAVDNATTELTTYRYSIARLKADVKVAESRLVQKKAALRVAEIERDQKIVKSPVDGKILEISTLTGGAIDTRQPFAQISPKGRTIAICEIDEMYADKVAVGQKAWIRNVGSQDTLSAGEVYLAQSFLKKKSLFTDQSGEKEDRRVRTIKIMLEQPEKLLLNARIECVIAISGNLKK